MLPAGGVVVVVVVVLPPLGGVVVGVVVAEVAVVLPVMVMVTSPAGALAVMKSRYCATLVYWEPADIHVTGITQSPPQSP